VNAVSAGWFDTYGVRLTAGRDFTNNDRMGAPRVAIVNRTFVRRFLGQGSPVGQEFTEDGGDGKRRFEVVGVVEDTVYRSLRSEMQPIMYLPVGQWDSPGTGITIGVKSAGLPPLQLARGIVDALSREDASAALSFHALSDQVGDSLTQERLVATLAGFFGALALMLAGIGLYGVTSHAVGARSGEIGVRIALGASAPAVVRLVLVRVAGLVAAGVVLGAGLSAWASRYVASLLYGLGPRDTATLLGAAVLLAMVGAIAGWLPARRAARLDPMVVLRES
jgi:ABC-type antimicrobial peptide transport system permease subunit